MARTLARQHSLSRPTPLALLSELATKANCRANLFPDAVIAAIAVEYGSTLHSHDRDFARFKGLRWLDPLRP